MIYKNFHNLLSSHETPKLRWYLTKLLLTKNIFAFAKHPLTDICAGGLCNLMILSEFNNGSPRLHCRLFRLKPLSWVLVMRTFSIFLELQMYSFGSKLAYIGHDMSLTNTGENISHILELSLLSWDRIQLKLRIVPSDDNQAISRQKFNLFLTLLLWSSFVFESSPFHW